MTIPYSAFRNCISCRNFEGKNQETDNKMKTRNFLFVLPFLLTLSCGLVFWIAHLIIGKKAGYLAGFLFYWIFWCLFIPIKLVGINGIKQLFIEKTVDWNVKVLTCLLLPLLFGYAYAFPSALKEANLLIIVLSFIMAVVNATLEEVLWRGVYFKTFKNHRSFSIIYSSFGFAVWHYAPQLVFRSSNPGGAHSFVAFAFFLGLLYSWVAVKQKSIFWVSISHILFDFSGLGARLCFK